MTCIVAPSLTGYPQPGVVWLPGQHAAMMRGETADATAETYRHRNGLVCDIPEETVHHCPPTGQYVTPCCGLTPFELPRTDRITSDPSLVTCHGCLACSELDYGPCTCKRDCGHLCCTGGTR